MEPLPEIPPEQWPTLEKLLKDFWCKTFIVCSWIKTRKRWNTLHPGKYPYFVCCPFGKIEDGLVAYGEVVGRVYYLTIYTFHDDLRNLQNALLQTSRIKWQDKMVCAVPTGMEVWFSDVLNTLGFKVNRDVTTINYILPKAFLQEFETHCTDEVYVDMIQQNDVSRINNIWKHKFDGSEILLSECLKLNYGFGVYCKKDNKLVSWVLRYEYGDVGVLYTDPSHRRKGYGKLVLHTICKQVAGDGDDILVSVVPGNTASENLMKSMGFQYSSSYNWLEYESI